MFFKVCDFLRSGTERDGKSEALSDTIIHRRVRLIPFIFFQSDESDNWSFGLKLFALRL